MAWTFWTNGRFCRGWPGSRWSSCRSRLVLSDKMVHALKEYVRNGGKLLVSRRRGVRSFRRRVFRRERRPAGQECRLPCAGRGRHGSDLQRPWRLLELGGAKSLGRSGPLRSATSGFCHIPRRRSTASGAARSPTCPAMFSATLPPSRYPLLRVFLHDVMRALAGRLEIEVERADLRGRGSPPARIEANRPSD